MWRTLAFAGVTLRKLDSNSESWTAMNSHPGEGRDPSCSAASGHRHPTYQVVDTELTAQRSPRLRSFEFTFEQVIADAGAACHATGELGARRGAGEVSELANEVGLIVKAIHVRARRSATFV